MSMSTPSPKSGVPCSACGAILVVSPTARWKKMQCPKCRAVITLPNPNAARPALETSGRGAVTDKTAPGRPEEARISAMEARLALLEKELVSLRRDRKAETGDRRETGLERPARDASFFRDAIWTAPPDRTLGDRADEGLAVANGGAKLLEIEKQPAKAERADVLPENSPADGPPKPVLALADERFVPPSEDRILQKLAEMTAGEVAIRVKEGDTEAILFGEWLGLAFIKAGWTVPSFEAHPLPPKDQNLTLSISGNFPFPKRASMIHSALTAAGLALAFAIDPTSHSPIPILIVPRRPVGTSDRAEVDPQRAPEGKLAGEPTRSILAPGASFDPGCCSRTVSGDF